MSQLPFDAVLFDCDGVLADSEAITNAVVVELLGEMGWQLTQEECLRIFMGHALRDRADVIAEHTGTWIDDAWITAFRSRRDEGIRASLRPIPGAVEAVRAAADAFVGRIAVASGADRPKVEMQLRIIGVADVFGEQVYSGMECARSKPAPDVYLAAAAGLGVDPTRAAVVEDTVPGVRAGVAAGAAVFGYAPGGPTHTAPELLLAAGASAVFERMEDLLDVLTASPRPARS